MKLSIITTSTRPGRVGGAVAEWAVSHARKHPNGFDIQAVDLAELDLPLMDEPRHPRFQDYKHEHTKRWSAIVDGSDAFVFVLPEYNFVAPPGFFNAVDYLYAEWNYKPAAFVSYGGISGGMRAVETAKSILTTVKVVPIPEGVVVPMVSRSVEDGVFTPSQINESAADTMVSELARWTKALRQLRD